MFPSDPIAQQPVVDSFPILQVDRNEMHLVREGHLYGELFSKLLPGAPIDCSQAHPAKYPLLRTDSLATITSPYELHDQLLRLLDGTGSESN